MSRDEVTGWHLQARLKPVAGERFSPAKFPDVGAGEYTSALGQTHLLVESRPSMANRLESAIWDSLAGDVIEPLRGMPYVSMEHPEHGLISSITESHRIASPYLFPALEEKLLEALGPCKGRHLPHQVARALLRLDPGSLIHGAFLIDLRPVVRTTHLLSSAIEARNVTPIIGSGVHLDLNNPSGPATKRMGHIPFPRIEYAAEQIVADFVFDGILLEDYGLSPTAQEFLSTLALLKVRRFLDRGLRLRADCHFELVELRARQPSDYDLPEQDSLLDGVRRTMAALQASGEMGAPTRLEA